MYGFLCDSACLALPLKAWNDSFEEDSRIKDATKTARLLLKSCDC